MPVDGNGLYSTLTGFTPGVSPGGPTSAGTYQWNVSYSGDANNNSANNDPAEQVTVNQAAPTLSTTPDSTDVTLGGPPTPPVTLNDTADLEGGFDPTGHITFTLVGPGGGTVDTEMVLVDGNGLYHTPTGFTLSGPHGVGTYQWNASYSGDTNNTSASDLDAPTEQVTVNPANPTLSTTPNPTTATLGGGPSLTLNDRVDLEGGFNPTGHITFTLVGPGGGTVDSEIVSVGGNGFYHTPTGFTLSGSDAAGTYQWNAAYSGDTNNNAVSDLDAPTEQVTVTPCYCAGTLILTDRGEVAVEDLAIGDKVVTVSGEAKPIRWIGRCAYDGRFIAGNRDVLPIRITEGALTEGVPARDLWVSPAHALYFDGVLVHSEHLLNGMTIIQAERVETVEYFHIELDEHDVIFAEGAPAETFVDCDNRLMFRNGAEYARLYPDDDRPRWTFCAPQLDWEDESGLSAIRAGLMERAAALGHAFDEDPDLRLLVDGEVVRPLSQTDGVYRFAVPAAAGSVWLASKSAVPAETDSHSRDRRRLGVAVERLLLCDSELSIEAWHGHAALAEGFHDDEGTHRWTDGLAKLPDSWRGLFGGDCVLEIRLFPGWLRYPATAPKPKVKATTRPPRSAKPRRAANAPSRKRTAVPAAASSTQRKRHHDARRDRGSASFG